MKSAVTTPWPRSLMFLISAAGKVFSCPTRMPTRFMTLCYPLIGQIAVIRDVDPYFHPSRSFEPSYLSPGVVVKLIRQGIRILLLVSLMLQSRPTQAREQKSENRDQRSKSYGREKLFDVSGDDNSCDVTVIGCRRQLCRQTGKRPSAKGSYARADR